MKKIKTFIIICVFTILGFVFGACGSEVIAEQNYPLKIWKENRNGQMNTWCLVDDNTGVNYIVVGPSFSENGHEYGGVCITPRLNPDGSLYISK